LKLVSSSHDDIFLFTYGEWGDFLQVSLKLKWEFLDANEDVVFTELTSSRSGEFVYEYQYKKTENEELAKRRALIDAIENGFLEVIKTDKVKLLNPMKKNEALVNEVLDDKKGDKDAITSRDIEKININQISIFNDGRQSYLVKNNSKTNIFKEQNGMHTKDILTLVKDDEILHSFAKANMHEGFGYLSSFINCYNHRQLHPEIKFTPKYYHQFGLITSTEFYDGPSDELLKTKLPISYDINQIIIQKFDSYNNRYVSQSDNFKVLFSYGKTEFRKGPFVKNIMKAVSNDEEALVYIKEYRKKVFTRVGLVSAGVSFAVLTGVLATRDSDLSEALLVPTSIASVLLINIPLFLDRTYKSTLTKKAFDTYNKNLGFEVE